MKPSASLTLACRIYDECTGAGQIYDEDKAAALIDAHTAAAVAKATAPLVEALDNMVKYALNSKLAIPAHAISALATYRASIGETGEPQTRFVLNDQQWDELAEILSAPATRNERLAALLSGRMGETERKG